MTLELVSWMESLSVFSEYLPVVVRAIVWVTIALIGFLPLSILCWMLMKTLGQALSSLIRRLESISNDISINAKKVFARANRKSKSFKDNHSIVVEYKNENISINSNPLQVAVDELDAAIKNAPALITDAERKKSIIVTELHGQLDRLSSNSAVLEPVEIPSLEFDKGIEVAKRNALSGLWIFAFLLLAVVVTNTALLNTFFDELFDEREILGVPYAILVALMFTLIEAGAGIVIGYIEVHSRKDKKDPFLTVKVFAWSLILCLMLVEFALYLLVAAQMSDMDLKERIADADWFGIAIEGYGWLSLLGFGIVAGLYVFGHMTSRAYFTYFKHADVQRLKRDLDTNFDLYTRTRDLVDGVAAKTKEIVDELRAENIVLGNTVGVTDQDVSKLSNMIESKKKVVEKVIKEIETTEFPAPEIQVSHLGPSETTSFIRFNFVYLALLCTSVFVYFYALPEVVQLGEMKISSQLQKFSFAFLPIALSVFSGFLIMSEVNVVNLTDGRIASLHIQRKGVPSYVLVFLLATTVVTVTYALCGTYQPQGSMVSFLIALASVIGGFFVGRVILHALSVWYSGLEYLGIVLFGCSLIFVKWAVQAIEMLVGLIHQLIASLAIPVVWFAKEKS